MSLPQTVFSLFFSLFPDWLLCPRAVVVNVRWMCKMISLGREKEMSEFIVLSGLCILIPLCFCLVQINHAYCKHNTDI